MKLSDALAKISKDWHVFFAWIETLIHHHEAGTLPPAPQPGQSAIITGSAGGSTPPVDHGAMPPDNAGSTGVNVGQPVPGGDTPDTNGAIAIPAVASKFPPGSRFLTVAALPFVSKASAQAFTIAANCQNVKFLEGAFVNVPDFSNYQPLPAVENPASAVAVGGPKFHLHGQAPGEGVFSPIQNCIAISNDLTTVDEVVAYCAKLPDYGSVHPVSPVAGPGGAGHGQFK